jgi:hypothetical protein
MILKNGNWFIDRVEAILAKPPSRTRSGAPQTSTR